MLCFDPHSANCTLWDEIPGVDQSALIEWYNVSDYLDINDNDRRLLADLYWKGLFSCWNCPECNELILVGEPDDWNDFRGVSQSEPVGWLCADCGEMFLRLKSLCKE